MAFHCMSCNGSMVFDVSLQKMRCEHCGSTCEPQDFDMHDDAVVMTSITCQNCGAELEGTDDSMVGFCPYCGGQSLIKRPGGACDVEQLIPFKVSKEKCIEAYGAYAKRVPYLNKEFKDPEHIKKFTGIYMPYYQYDATFGDADVQGETSTEHARYTEVKTYRIDLELEGAYEHGAPFDASKYLDDEISARCMPFNTAEERPFNPAYLAGFYADTSTTSADLYEDDARMQAEQDLISAVSDTVMGEHKIPVKVSKSHVDTTITGHHSVLFPLWFLTWRKDDRVAYAVINGESGQVVSDLPLDLKAFALGCVAISAALFVLLELLFQPTPGITAFASVIAAALMAAGIHTSAKRVHDMQTHAQDKGWTGDEEAQGGVVKAKEHKHVGWSTIVAILPFFILGFFWLRIGSSRLDIDGLFDAGSPLMMGAPLAVLLIVAFVLYKVLKWHKDIKKWDAPVAIGALALSVLVNTIIIFVAPVNDFWYYLGDVACILGLIGSSVAMLRVYNLSTTRPLPKLFDREEV